MVEPHQQMVLNLMKFIAALCNLSEGLLPIVVRPIHPMIVVGAQDGT